MPRILSATDFEDDETLEQWETQRQETRNTAREQAGQRSGGIRRFSGGEALDRKRAERRKHGRRHNG